MALTLSGSDGSVSAPAVSGGTSGATNGLYFPTTNQVAISTNGTQAILFDANQNVGIGVTPSAWYSTNKALQINSGASVSGSTSSPTQINISANWYNNASGADTFIGTGYATLYQQNIGLHRWFTSSASGTAGGAATLNTLMTLDTSGNLGIGVTPNVWSAVVPAFQIGGAFLAAQGVLSYSAQGTNAYYNGTNWIYRTSATASVYQQSGGVHSWNSAPSGTAGANITFTALMTLDNSGNLLVGITTNASSDKFVISYNGSVRSLAVNSSGNVYLYSLGTGTVYSNGGVLTNTNPSDQNLKTNIIPINWGLVEINKLNPVSYSWKNDPINQGTQYGFIAQEVQSIMPDLVKSFKAEDGNEYLGLEKEGIYATLVKAIQELSAEVTALKAKVGI